MVTKEQLAELEATHKRIAHLKGAGEPVPWEVVIRKPTRIEYKMFRSQTHNQAQIADAQEILIRKIAVFPTGDQLDALIEEWPAIPEACGKALSHLTGMAATEEGK